MKQIFLVFVVFVFALLGYVGYKLVVPPEKEQVKAWSRQDVASISMKVEVDYDAPVVERQEIFIKAEPWKVFSRLKNVDEWPQWQQSVTAGELLGQPEAGTKFNWAAGWMRFKSEFHTFKKFDSIGWTGSTSGTNAIHNWRFREVNGGTQVFVEESLDGWLPLLLTSTFREELHKGMTTNLQELKRACESGKG